MRLSTTTRTLITATATATTSSTTTTTSSSTSVTTTATTATETAGHDSIATNSKAIHLLAHQSQCHKYLHTSPKQPTTTPPTTISTTTTTIALTTGRKAHLVRRPCSRDTCRLEEIHRFSPLPPSVSYTLDPFLFPRLTRVLYLPVLPIAIIDDHIESALS